MKKLSAVLLLILLFVACSRLNTSTLFRKLSAQETGVDFENRVEETNELNVLVYEYFYNGGGVAAADFDNDGLIDLYFTGNQTADKIYKNTGNLKFQDKTPGSGIVWNKEWKTGVTVVDINDDGLKDIYVSVSGHEENPELRKNKFYINQGNFRFIDKAAEYGLDCNGFTTQTAFFDFDKDGDLDAYVMNHNVKDFKRFDVEAVHFMRDEFAGDRLYRNDKGKFVDVSIAAGIKGNPIGFGLGIHTADLNQDNWPDIYISNDYLEGDYLYINNRDGTFTDKLAEMVDHTSYFSMGNDVADINNDALPDIFTADMLPEDNHRQKLLFGPDNYEAYLSMLRNGFHPEIMRNMLHQNEGNGHFAEMGQLAGISNTDWSWSPLLADFDNDGFKDLFISNGYLRDYTNNDFIKFYAEKRTEGQDNVLEIINKMPATKVANYVFRNKDGQQFENVQKAWGFDEKNITNGAVYADLDNDGDLEIITNNLNEKAVVYENTAVKKKGSNNFLVLNFDLPESQLLNSKIEINCSGRQYRELTPTHGFQSSYAGPVHFGIGKAEKVDSLTITYPDGEVQVLTNIRANSFTTIKKSGTGSLIATKASSLFSEITLGEFVHNQLGINDFSRQILLPWMYSYQGPCLAVGDVNADGLEDFYLGGGKRSPGQLAIALPGGGFKKSNEALLKQWELCTDVDAEFFDVEGDGDLDLYVVGGGYEYLPNDLLLQNRLYINDGKGNFTKEDAAFPPDLFSDACVEIFDADADGDKDVFVGGFVLPGNYPGFNPSRLYKNNGGKFEAIQTDVFSKLGLVKDAVTSDYNSDGKMDLIVVGEWTNICFLKSMGDTFVPDETPMPKTTGLWQSILANDFDGDGDQDLVVGNWGLNSQLCASEKEPLRLHTADYDGNGRMDPILSCFNQGQSYPFYSRDEILDQLFPLRKKYTSYSLYANENTEALLKNFPKAKPEVLEATELRSLYLENQTGTFVAKPFPIQLQAAPIYSLLATDADGDGDTDLLAAGNNWHTRVRLGNVSANHGQVFLNNGKGDFSYLPSHKSGIWINGEVRAMRRIKDKILFARNQNTLVAYRFLWAKTEQ